jgi:hypothetical protein
MIPIDSGTAVVVCAGPSLDRLTDEAWKEIGQAGAVVGVNGAPASLACTLAATRFTCIAAMDLASGLADRVPALRAVWQHTAAWRVASTESSGIAAETYVDEVDEAHGIEGWSDAADAGYKGGSTGMVIGNWLGNDWADDPAATADVLRIARQAHKPVPRRGFKRLAYVGLDMHRRNGGHALGAGAHTSGFSDSLGRYRTVCRGWGKFCEEAARRGIEVVNLTPGTGLAEMPRADIPASWVRA